MDIGEVDDSQSALQSHLDWPGQWQVGEWDFNAVGNYCYTCGAAGHSAKDCPNGKGKGKHGKGLDRGKGKGSGRYQGYGYKERATSAARWSTSMPSAGSIGRTIRTRFAP